MVREHWASIWKELDLPVIIRNALLGKKSFPEEKKPFSDSLKQLTVAEENITNVLKTIHLY